MLLRKDIEVVITALTRNQVYGNVSWVRIPLFPPKNLNRTEVWFRFLFLQELISKKMKNIRAYLFSVIAMGEATKQYRLSVSRRLD